MSAERYLSWNERLIVEFARDKVDSGNWSADDALDRSAEENKRDLPQGLATPGHDIFVGHSDGEEVGVLWLFTDPGLTTSETMIYDIEIAEQHRGKGFGRELLTAAERWCAGHGIGVYSSFTCSRTTSPRSTCTSRLGSRRRTSTWQRSSHDRRALWRRGTGSICR